MEENNINEQNQFEETKKHICFEDHCWKMCLASVLAAFIGGFLAVYFVTDQIMYRVHKNFDNRDYFEQKIFDDFNRNFDKDLKYDMKHFDKMLHKHNEFIKKQIDKDIDIIPSEFLLPEEIKIKTKFEDGNYNVIVNLKPFQNDDNKVNYNISGRKLTVFGQSKVKDKHTEQDISFSQDFFLPEGSDNANIKKIKDGDKLIISVPVKIK